MKNLPVGELSFTQKTSPITSPIRGVVLDWAGTTVDYGSCAPAGAFVEVFRRRNIEISYAQARGPMGMDKRTHIAELLRLDSVASQWKARYGKASTEDDLDTLYKEFIPIQINCLKDFSQLIPGTLETAAALRKSGIKIGTTTGYSSDMIGIVAEEAKKQGFVPDTVVCSTDVKAGRPAPWMALRAAERMGIYPLHTIVKIGDTVADIEEGLNCGMWTIGLAKTGNELGLSLKETEALSQQELSSRLDLAYKKLTDCGAHYVVDGISDIIPILNKIGERISKGERA